MPNITVPQPESLAALDRAAAVSEKALRLLRKESFVRREHHAALAVLVTLAVCPVSPRRFERHGSHAEGSIKQLVERAFDLLSNPEIAAAFHRVRDQISRRPGLHPAAS